MEGEILKSIIRSCDACKDHLPFEPNPVFSFTKSSKIVIIGQAPGRKVHESNIPWDDLSGKKLRSWLGVNEEQFYNPSNFAIIPMAFCYPGKGKTGDLPPSKVCAPLWHKQINSYILNTELTILVGAHAQQYYLKGKKRKNLTETVRNYHEFLPDFFPIVHPSPLNFRWHAKNEWFEHDVLPSLYDRVHSILKV
ncbi:uracil-DNA glycosylase family protein [Putridiphycobacter roseus]|uniref:Uracil-DNA glycosylase family protein n=1 Tax=Putridiphycobacter roseus TaxID=2219161 RepID=A0A2W1N1R7_9FLAO|nr:uracil-DNA glycosylase family protein [Putridiphycobacter roseus]PZE17744.1 uracil-DNA glycosylase family protein [Putridiphycobacter roseus]